MPPMPPMPSKDHPRGRGEQVLALWLACVYQGSPPRARGAVLFQEGHDATARITPAGAGSRQKHPVLAVLYRDHPRGRGEQKADAVRQQQELGSPPRARGADA